MNPRTWPIRLRLALAFAGVMALVLAATGAFVYERTAADLDRQIARELDARLAGVIAIIRDDGDDLGDPEQDPLDRVDAEGVVQVLDPDGRVADATAEQLRDSPLLDAQTLAALVDGERDAADVDLGGELGRLRVVAARTRDDGVRYTILAGAPLADREQALESLSRVLLIGGPIALLLASLAGYWVATAALRPVEAMRRRAAEISEDEHGRRLPVPPSQDEIADLGTTLNAMLDRLEAALDRERRFVADASHELRTPLSIVRAEIELALTGPDDAVELRRALESVGDESERLQRLAEDLLVIARADEGRLPVKRERVPLAPLVERTVAARGVEVTTSVDGGIELDVDPLRLEQAIGNLIDNAGRYGAGEIAVTASRNGDSVELHVLDRGPGLPEEFVPRAFERFARPQEGGRHGGAGLGLAIVSAIATAHGGSAGIANREGGGADAWLRLPAAS